MSNFTLILVLVSCFTGVLIFFTGICTGLLILKPVLHYTRSLLNYQDTTIQARDALLHSAYQSVNTRVEPRIPAPSNDEELLRDLDRGNDFSMIPGDLVR